MKLLYKNVVFSETTRETGTAENVNYNTFTKGVQKALEKSGKYIWKYPSNYRHHFRVLATFAE